VSSSFFGGAFTPLQVLSDRKERAWYDSHRRSILRGTGDDGKLNNYKEVPIVAVQQPRRKRFDSSPGNGFNGVVFVLFTEDGDENDEYIVNVWSYFSASVYK